MSWPRRIPRAAVLLSIALSPVAFAGPPSLAIVGVDGPPYMVGISDEIARMTVDAARSGYRIVEPAQVRTALGEAAMEKLAACTEAACRAQILSPLRVDRAFGGSLSQNETSYVVGLWLLDVPARRTVAQLNRSILIASRHLEADLAEALPRMLAGKAEGGGEIVVRSQPPASMVDVDDSPVGGGAEVHKTVEPGKHRVVIQADGYLTIERWVQVAAEQVVRLNEALIPVGGHIEEAPPEKEAAKAKKEKAAEGGGGGGFSVPVASWVGLGVSAATFGTGLYFGVTANNFDHLAGQTDSNGVQQGLTRSQALAGQTDAQVANYLYIGAGAVLVAAIVIAIVTPGGGSAPASAPANNSSPLPTALHWSFP